MSTTGQFGLLQQLYGNVHIPEAVWGKLNSGGIAWPGRDAVAEASWIDLHTVHNATAVTALLDDLDRGEAEAIVLPLELGADLLLLDEADGRHHAQRLGLHVTGVIGTLRAAKEKQLIEAVRPHLDALRSVAGFYIAEDLYQFVLETVGE